MANKDYVSAEHAYLEVLKIQPKSPAALNNLAWVTSQQKKEGALAYAEQANKLAPNQPAFMDTLAAVLGEAKQFDAAIELQKRAIALQPSNPDLKFSLAKLYLKSGDKSNARQELNRLASMGNKFSAQAEVASMLGSL
jgi:predicted Zn-dependent protease